MAEPVILIASIIAIALFFDFINGFHDAANSIATVVATNVLKPHQAVLMAAFWNFIGAFVFGVAIAATIAKGLVVPGAVTIWVILAGLLGAIVWDLLTWWYGLPSSSSHALIGGFVGAAVMAKGLGVIIYGGVLKVFIFIFVAPSLGLLGAFIFTEIMRFSFRNAKPAKVQWIFRHMQIVSSSFYSLGHGTNDAQKTMGIITILLFSGGYLADAGHVPVWVILASHASIAIGTYFGGWRIVKTMGQRITKLRPFDGFGAETAGGAVLAMTSHLGIPVSTTHVIAGSIVGVGLTKGRGRVRWPLARNIVWAWILTIPASALIAALSYFTISLFI